MKHALHKYILRRRALANYEAVHTVTARVWLSRLCVVSSFTGFSRTVYE